MLDEVPNLDKLESALNTLVERHDSLRTYFEIVEGNIVQKIASSIKITIKLEESNTDDLEQLFSSHQSSFDLSKAPLFTVSLLHMPSGKALLILDIHHIIFDGTSLNNLLDELSALYNGKSLPELPISYKDYAIWEDEQLKNNGFKNSKKYWLDQFKDDIPVLNLPTSYARPAIKSYEGATFITSLSHEMTEKINQFCNDYHITPYTFLLATYYILLYKYTSQEDIVVRFSFFFKIISRITATAWNVCKYFTFKNSSRFFYDTTRHFRKDERSLY